MAEVTQEEHEHKASSIAKAGLTTGIIGTSLGALNMLGSGAGLLGLIGGNNGRGNAQAEKLEALRDENLLLKSAANTEAKYNDLNVRFVRQEEQIKALRAETYQAINTEALQRQNADASLRQYTDDNFVRAKKCVDAQAITPPVMVFPYGNPSNAPVAPWPLPFPPFNPLFPPPAQGSTSSGTTTPTDTANNG